MPEEKTTFEPAMCGHCEGLGCLYCNKTGTVLVACRKNQCHHCEGIGCLVSGYPYPPTRNSIIN